MLTGAVGSRLSVGAEPRRSIVVVVGQSLALSDTIVELIGCGHVLLTQLTALTEKTRALLRSVIRIAHDSATTGTVSPV
jgi:hypothetical protein